MVFEKNLDLEYSEESEYQQKSISMNEIVLRHLRKIGDICCQELTGSYTDKRPIRTQSGVVISETYHTDLREAYCNAVDFLIDIIYARGDLVLKYYLSIHEGFVLSEKELNEVKKLKEKGEIINGEKENNKNDDLKEDEEDINIKLKQKRKTFRQINLMFERTNFWSNSDSSNE